MVGIVKIPGRVLHYLAGMLDPHFCHQATDVADAEGTERGPPHCPCVLSAHGLDLTLIHSTPFSALPFERWLLILLLQFEAQSEHELRPR